MGIDRENSGEVLVSDAKRDEIIELARIRLDFNDYGLTLGAKEELGLYAQLTGSRDSGIGVELVIADSRGAEALQPAEGYDERLFKLRPGQPGIETRDYNSETKQSSPFRQITAEELDALVARMSELPETPMEQLAEELLDPAQQFEDGLRGISDRLKEMAESVPFPGRFYWNQAVEALGKAGYFHRVEQGEGFTDLPTHSVLWCLDCERGIHFAPAAARAVYELERAGNTAVDEVIGRKKAMFAEAEKPKALAWTEKVEEHLAELRAASPVAT